MEQKVDKINLKMFSLYFKLDKFFVLFKFNPRNLIDLFIEVFVIDNKLNWFELYFN